MAGKSSGRKAKRTTLNVGAKSATKTPRAKKASTAKSHLLQSAKITPDAPTWTPKPSGRGAKKKIKSEGWSAPFLSSPYNEPPHPMESAKMIVVEFEPDPDAAWDAVPDPLEWVPGTTGVACIGDNRQMPTSQIFQEGMVVLKVKLGDEIGSFTPYIWTSTDEAMLAAREVSGRPKMMCDHNELQIMGSSTSAVITRRGETLMRASATLEKPAEVKELPFGGAWFSVRKVQMPEEGRPALKQVIKQALTVSFRAQSIWRGRGFCEFPGQSISDVWKLAPKPTGRAWMIHVSWDLQFGKIVWENWVPAIVD